jgi:hypothetical protein
LIHPQHREGGHLGSPFDTLFDPFRPHPAFQALLRKMNLAP